MLAEVQRHPNRRYYVLKSIIVRNLYGVDIMDEAVEICRLRLFLKLVAQVDEAQRIEPLPDIDFNIRAGNTLVGFTSLKEVEEALTLEQKGGGSQTVMLGMRPEENRALQEVREATRAPVMLHADEVAEMDESIKELSYSDTFRAAEIPADRLLQDGGKIEAGKVTLEVIHTPGHTSGSICLKAAPDIVFTGDTLFAGSIGSVGSQKEFEQLISSIQTRLLVFPAGTKIYPGHGPGSIVDVEKRNNPMLMML